MNVTLPLKRASWITGSVFAVSMMAVSGVASAAAASAQSTENTQTRLTAIKSKGDQEISRRLTTLNGLASKINAAAKLSSSDKSYLSSEVATEISGLTTLKTKLDADTTISDAKTDAQSIYNDYRVYALIVPKVELVKTADDQQVTESKLTALAAKLQSRITTAQQSGKDVSALQAKLVDLKTQVTNAQAISSSIENKVLTLQPADYDSNHAVLSGDAAQLKTAHTDNQAAYADAKAIVSALKSL